MISKDVDEWIFISFASKAHMTYIVEISIISYERFLTFV